MTQILHFGIGNFHRAHQAYYTQDSGWGIVGVSLRSAGIRDKLRPQGFDYTLAIKEAAGVSYDTIDVIRDVIVAPEDPARVIAQVADPATQIISMTVTENGYCLDGAGQLDLHHPDIASDLASEHPKSLIGFLARGLAARWAANEAPVTVMSCDNLPENGAKLRSAVLAFACAADLDIGEALDRLATFPNAMVDRITPATTDTLIREVAKATGTNDRAPVETEGFSEWVIEDRFATDRPGWAKRGASFVADVAPFEARKLRLLNGAHSFLAYAGQRAGHTYVHEAIADPELRRAVKTLFAQAASTLPEASRADWEDYADALVRRFENPALNHALAQIAMDGTLKMPIRWGAVIAAAPDSSPYIAGAAAWVQVVHGQVARGERPADPSADHLVRVCAGVDSADQAAPALLDLALPESPENFRQAVLAAL